MHLLNIYMHLLNIYMHLLNIYINLCIFRGEFKFIIYATQVDQGYKNATTKMRLPKINASLQRIYKAMKIKKATERHKKL